MTDLRALLVSYAFPPTGGVGVARMVKLSKYLGASGVRPAVLTVANPSVPLRDASFDRDLPAGMEIVRARTFEPGFGVKQTAWAERAGQRQSVKRKLMGTAVRIGGRFLVPDPQLLWQPGAAMALGRRLATRRDDVILVSAPPFSQFLLAPLARLHRRVAVVLDYRDEWSTLRKTYEMIAGRLASAAGERMETGVLRAAHYVTTATEPFRQHLLDRYPFLAPDRVVTIPNGYDREDLPGLPPLPADRLIVTYAGTVFKLTSTRGFLDGVRLLHQRAPELARSLEVRFFGRIVETEADAFAGTESLGVHQLGFVPHDQVMGKLADSHLVLCVLDDVPDVERILPAKIFELMALGRRVVTLAPEGELARLVRDHRLGALLPPRDPPAIAEFLEQTLRRFRDGMLGPPPAPVDIERYDRRNTAQQFADVMRRAVALTGG